MYSQVWLRIQNPIALKPKNYRQYLHISKSGIIKFIMNQKQDANLQDYLLPLGEALLFIGSVYLQKFVRKNLKLWSKQYKEMSRIIFVTTLTLILIAFNYSEKCRPFSIDAQNCLYLHFDIMQCFHVIAANTVLFAYHIYRKVNTGKAKDLGDSPARTIIFAPLLQQLLFRAVFYRSSNGRVSIFYLSALFALAHLHRHIRKAVSGKKKRYSAAFFQLIFTFILSLYSYFYLYHYQSIIPSIVLHAYCNYLGPPIVKGKNCLIYHSLCVIGFSLYLIFII